MPDAPAVAVIAGPNGAGKSTAAPVLLHEALGIQTFVDADVIARGLSAFDPESVAVTAARVMLARLHALADEHQTFGFETTLASRTFAPWLRRLLGRGYEVHLLFLWLPTSEFAIERVRDRVRLGGHHVPDATIRRRYQSGLVNFFTLYQPLATTWRMYDNSVGARPQPIANGRGLNVLAADDPGTWETIQNQVHRWMKTR